MEIALEIPLRPSRFGLGLLSFYALPLACLAGEGVPAWVCWLLPLLVLGMAMLSFRKIRKDWNGHLLLLPSGEAYLRLDHERPEGVPVQVLKNSSDLGWLVVLRWKELESGAMGLVCLVRDGLPKADWRRLRVWLRWKIRNSSV